MDRPRSRPRRPITTGCSTPVSSGEIAAAGNPAYGCCTFRGQVVAYAAASGKRLWTAYAVEEPRPQGRNSAGTPVFGPSGAPVWNTPTVDARRGALYFGTGENYSDPVSGSSDAIIAVDLKTGRRKWVFQGLAGDVEHVLRHRHPGQLPGKARPRFRLCRAPGAGHAEERAAGAGGGAEIGLGLWAGPGYGAADLAPQGGARGAAGGIHFSLAAEGGRVYVPVADTTVGVAHPGEARPGLYALDAANGDYLWQSPVADLARAARAAIRAHRRRSRRGRAM
jgi:polyvinyl alcohol dehydrogenase (cytochrome)